MPSSLKIGAAGGHSSFKLNFNCLFSFINLFSLSSYSSINLFNTFTFSLYIFIWFSKSFAFSNFNNNDLFSFSNISIFSSIWSIYNFNFISLLIYILISSSFFLNKVSQSPKSSSFLVSLFIFDSSSSILKLIITPMALSIYSVKVNKLNFWRYFFSSSKELSPALSSNYFW
jgi:hypothetical protein